MVGQAVDCPLNIVNVSQGFILFDQRVIFAGVFARPDSVKEADIARSIYAFEWPVYLLIFCYLISFAVVFKVLYHMRMRMYKSFILAKGSVSINKSVLQHLLRRNELKLKKSLGFLDTFRHFSRTHFNNKEPSFSIVFLSMFLTLFSFFTFSHFNSLLNTVPVIPNKAKLYENYDKLMESNARPVFLEGTSYYKDLK